MSKHIPTPADFKPEGLYNGKTYSELSINYGLALAFMNSSPDLRRLFNEAVQNSWQPAKFQAELMNTKWFQHHSASVRNAILQKTSDPATYNANVAQMEATIQSTWGAMWGSPLGEAQVKQWAVMAHDLGWSQEQIAQHLGNATQWQKMMTSQGVGGKAAETMDALRQFQQNYGIKYSEQWAANQAHNVLEGKDTLNGIEARFRTQAATNYPAYAAAIQSGQTLKDIADPYIQAMGQTLEIDPKSVNLFDPHIQKALNATSQDGKPATLSLSAFNQQLRSDPRWQYTDNAKQTVYDTTSTLLKDFGLSA